MAVARTSLRTFLQHSKLSLANAIAKGQKVTFVIGNESADLDSLTSSLILAYIRSNAPPAHAFTRLYYPVLNIPSKDINLRPEFLALFPLANVEPGTFITLDDLPASESLAQKLPPEHTFWVLVDHNVLQGDLGSIYSDRTKGVIDHHDDEHKIPDDTGDEPRIIKKSGSCTSLVTNYCRDAWDRISSQAASPTAAAAENDACTLSSSAGSLAVWDAQVAKLAIASILIDTHNLQDKNKVTEHDLDAVKYLEEKIMSSPQESEEYSRNLFFKEISKAKLDIGRLRLHDILRKDYKAWTAGDQLLGISSVVKDIDFLMDKAIKEGFGSSKSEAFLHAIDAFSEDRGLGMFAIMTTSTSADGEFQRELFLSATNTNTVKAASKFVKHSSMELGLEKWHGLVEGIDCTEPDCWRRLWQQRNVQHSRKRVAPLLREAFDD